MNMDEWNSRMRAQKEQERKKKTESAEILRGYRGGELSEEDRKLAAIKLEDRRKQEEAERNLREYRETHVEERERRQRKDPNYTHPPVVAKHEDQIEFESVAAKAAQFDSPVKAPSFESPRKIGGVCGQLGGFGVTDESLEREAEAGEINGAPNVSSTDPRPEELKEITQSLSGYSEFPEENEQEDEEKKVEQIDPELVSSSDPPLLHHPTVVRLDVNFSFGLITTSVKPVLDTYMLAVEEVVRKTLEDHPHLAQRVSYNPTYGPFVQDCINDGKFAVSHHLSRDAMSTISHSLAPTILLYRDVCGRRRSRKRSSSAGDGVGSGLPCQRRLDQHCAGRSCFGPPASYPIWQVSGSCLRQLGRMRAA
jgi:hypothetical protein